MSNGTPYADDDLRISKRTTPDEVRSFVENRVKNPIMLNDGETAVFHFSNHEPDIDALERMEDRLAEGYYTIPYQVPTGWGYMQRLIPDDVRDAEYLVWSMEQHRYRVAPNFFRKSDVRDDARFRVDLQEWTERQAHIP